MKAKVHGKIVKDGETMGIIAISAELQKALFLFAEGDNVIITITKQK